MAEVQKMGANQAQCNECGAVVSKGIKTCPQCGAASPTLTMAQHRRLALGWLYVGLPLGVVSIIGGIIAFVKMGQGVVQEGMEGTLNALFLGPLYFVLGILLIIIGFAGVIFGLAWPYSLKKREQLAATRKAGN